MAVGRYLAVRRKPWLLLLSGTTGLVVVLAVLLGVGFIGVMGAPTANSGTDPATCGAGSTYNPTSVTGTVGGLSNDQLNNARTIAGVAIAAKLGKIGVRIAIVTAYTESTLVSVNYGDIQNGSMTSSRGLYQQMTPWGALEKRLDPAGATTLFINGGDIVPEIPNDGHEPGLLDIPNWWTLDPWVAAQSVERSEFSNGSNYRGNLAVTDAIVDQLLTGQTVPDMPDPTITAETAPAPAAGQGSNVMVSGAAAPPTAAGCGTVPGASPGAANPASGLQQSPSQDPSSFGWVRAANQVPFSWQGHTFGEVAAGTEPLWTGLLNDLVPQIPGGLNSNLGCFEDRNNVNNPSMVSFHAYGLACDINFDANPNGANPSNLSGQYVIPVAAAQAAAAKWGMEWGGDFRGTPDPMHFEIHLSPQQIATLGTASTTESATTAPALAGAAGER